MQSLSSTVGTVYSKLNKQKNSIQYSSEEVHRIISNLTDVIPDDGYQGFYVNRLKTLGVEQFTWLANRARAGSDTPAKLFCWMLKNPERVK